MSDTRLSGHGSARRPLGLLHLLGFLAALLLPRGASAVLTPADSGALGAADIQAAGGAVISGAATSTAGPLPLTPPALVREWGS